MRIIGKLEYEKPGEYQFYNRGVSGNKIVDIYARIKRDILNLKPDIMSILVGVNDVWHDIKENEMERNGIDADKYFMIYDMLIREVFEALPDIFTENKIIYSDIKHVSEVLSFFACFFVLSRERRLI